MTELMSVHDLRRVAHRATHYDESHRDVAVVTFPRHSCDDEAGVIGISYRDIARTFGALADLLESRETNATRLREAIATALAGHSEILHKRMFTCSCGDFSVPLTAADIRSLFLRHRADAVIEVLWKTGVSRDRT